VRDHRPFGGIEGFDHLGILDPRQAVYDLLRRADQGSGK
jgi:hypothetical protein